MAVHADVIRLFCRKPEQLLPVRTMLVMAAGAGKLFLLSVDHVCLLAVERMPGAREASNRMGPLGNTGMTLQADVIDRSIEQCLSFRSMRLMAFHAETGDDDRMNNFGIELGAVVAGEAQVRHLLTKQPFKVRLMGLMTGYAHCRLDRRVFHLLAHDLVPAVAAETDIRNFFQQKLGPCGSMGCMAPGALTVIHRTMDPVFAGEKRFVMAEEAEIRRCREQKLPVLAAVRVVAGSAHASCDGGMNGLVLKLRLVMTVETKIRHGCYEKLRIIGNMRIVTGKTLPLGNRRMFDVMGKGGLVVAGETEIGSGREQEFPGLCFRFMRLRMTGDAPPGLDNGMNYLSLILDLVALGTVRNLFCGCRRGSDTGSDKDDNVDQDCGNVSGAGSRWLASEHNRSTLSKSSSPSQ